MEFATILKSSESKSLKTSIMKLGGTLISKCTKSVAAIFAYPGTSFYT